MASIFSVTWTKDGESDYTLKSLHLVKQHAEEFVADIANKRKDGLGPDTIELVRCLLTVVPSKPVLVEVSTDVVKKLAKLNHNGMFVFQ